MLKLSQLLDAKKRDSWDANTPDSSPQSRTPHSPLTVNSSAPVSPALSLLSAKGHTRFSSASSLASCSGHGNSMESSRNQLSGVREEPRGCKASRMDQEYFRMSGPRCRRPMLTGAEHFDQGMTVAEDAYFSSIDHLDDYDLTDRGLEIAHSPRSRCSDGTSLKGISRIGSRISTISTRWKPRRSSVGTDEDGSFIDPRSRANSASSVLASPVGSPTTRVEASIPPSPARTIFEEPASESGTQPIDIGKPNHETDDSAPQATTPLLPPFMGDDPTSGIASRVQSPLQSPSVASMTEEPLATSITDLRLAGIPSPPLSSKPSIASFGRPGACTVRTPSGDASPFTLSDPKDEWANKLGHANFTIQPEPYVPEVCDLETLRQLRTQWDLARCNFAKHLVRTGEHYGVTSNIYKLTEEKWESINREWKQHHESMLSELDPSAGACLSLTKSHLHPCEQLKIPRLHDNKFPELGDQEIVGPMKIAPAMDCRNRSIKRDFVRFFHDLVGKP